MNNIDKMNNNSVAALRYALTVARTYKVKAAGPYHLLLGILHISNSETVKYLDKHYSINYTNVNQGMIDLNFHQPYKDFDENSKITFSYNAVRIIENVTKNCDGKIDVCHLLIALLRADSLSVMVLSNFVECEKLYYDLLEMLPQLVEIEEFVNQVTIE